MDGIDRLIEMLEKRFGKFWADGLLLIAVLGAAAWGLHSLVVDFIIPAASTIAGIISYFRGGPITFTRGEIIYVALEFFGTATFIVLSQTWWRWWFNRERADVRRQGLQLDELLSRGQKYAEEIHAQADREIEAARATAIEVDSIVRDARAFSNKTFAELRAANAKATAESHAIVEQARIGANQILDKARAQIKAVTPSPQSPLDTEQEKPP